MPSWPKNWSESSLNIRGISLGFLAFNFCRFCVVILFFFEMIILMTDRRYLRYLKRWLIWHLSQSSIRPSKVTLLLFEIGRCCHIPLLTESSATPQPVAPPPITSISNSVFSRASNCCSLVGNGAQAYRDSLSVFASTSNAPTYNKHVYFFDSLVLVTF